MSIRDLIILGSSSQQPTRFRNHGAYLFRWNDEGLLFDRLAEMLRCRLAVNRSLKARVGEGALKTVALLPGPNHIVEAAEGEISEAAFHKIVSGHTASSNFICKQGIHPASGLFLRAMNDGGNAEINDAVNEAGVPSVCNNAIGIKASEPFVGFFFALPVEFRLHIA